MAYLFANNATTTLSGAITISDTTVQLANGAIFPQPTGTDVYVATLYDQPTKTIYEIVHVTSMSGNVAHIQRGMENTTARNWNVGDIFANLVTAGTLNQFVQAGTGAADTSLIYAGVDLGSPNQITCPTNPVPTHMAVNMQFNIKVAHTNTGDTYAQLNSFTNTQITRSDGHALVGGELTAGEELIMIYNGSTFSTMIPSIPQRPPQYTFYVDSAGSDSWNGLTPTLGAPNGPFASIQGAINTIKSKYVSSVAITLSVANGTYLGGASDSTNYIAEWNIIGNNGNPWACVINATSSNQYAYVVNAPLGRCFVSGGKAVFNVEGFYLESQYEQVAATEGGNISCQNCVFTAPLQGAVGPIAAHAGGFIWVYGQNYYSSTGTSGNLISADTNASVALGFNDLFGNDYCTMTIQGAPTFLYGTALATTNATIEVYSAVTTFNGAIPNGPQYQVQQGAGIIKGPFNFPGTQPGVIGPVSWVT
jgi:hypothetical protein